MLEPIEQTWLAKAGIKNNDKTNALLSELRKWDFSNPTWYSNLDALITNETSFATHEFIRHLFTVRSVTLEEKKAIIQILNDSKISKNTKRMAVRFLSSSQMPLEDQGKNLTKAFSKMSPKDQKIIAPFLPELNVNVWGILKKGLSDQDEVIRQASARRIAIEIKKNNGPWPDERKLQTLLADAIGNEPIRNHRLNLFNAFIKLKPSEISAQVLAKIASKDPSYYIRNQAIHELAELKPNDNEIFKRLLNAFRIESSRDNRIALASALIKIKPNNSELQLTLLHAAENADSAEMDIYLSKLNALELKSKKVKQELDRLANSPNKTLAKFGCGMLYSKIKN